MLYFGLMHLISITVGIALKLHIVKKHRSKLG